MTNQSINVSDKSKRQAIVVTNAPEQKIRIANTSEQAIRVSNATASQKIVIRQGTGQGIKVVQQKIGQCITISNPCPAKIELQVAINEKVPKALSILPQVPNEQLGTPGSRESTRLFVDANGVPSYATMEQIKRLNTKTLFVDALTDERIDMLSEGDIILLKEE